jgi:NAD(P)H-quinone oxidoreductase subunit 5
MLHLVAHSFYKSHAFLASGSVIDLVKGSKVKNVNRSVGLIKVALGIVMALALYTLFALIWGIDPVQELSLLAIGAVIVMGVSRLFVAAIVGKWRSGLMVYAMILALLVTVAFFTLESATSFLISSQVPSLTLPGWGKIWAASLILFSFGLAVFIQILAPQVSEKPYFRALAIHVRNGFYTNALFDRIIGALRISPTNGKKTIEHSVSSKLQPEKSKEKELEKQLA